ncbi:MAG: DNA translocase FtsK [Acidimicrobiia bacterium]|nr:DNA translocase FtsK [Acidimicrobiia bacterium]
MAKKPTKRSALGDSAREQLQGHGVDAIALGLIAGFLITALALATDMAGPIGSGIAAAVTAMLGNGAFLIPASFLAAALLLISHRGEDADTAAPPLRVAIGVVLVVIAGVGLLHVIGGAPPLSSGVKELRDAGGYLGAATSGVLVSGLGIVGASVVLVAVLVLGALLAPGVSIRRSVEVLVGAVRKLAKFARPTVEATVEGLTEDEAPAPARRVTVDNAGVYDQAKDETEQDAVASIVVDDEDEQEEVSPAPMPEVNAADISAVEADKGQMAIDLSAYGHGDWVLPPRDLLKRSAAKEVDLRMVDQGGEVLEATLKDFGVDARLIGKTVGPTVTRYELELAPGVKVNRITGLSHDIAYAMASSDVRILAPIPGRSAVGVEVPNKQRQLVTLGDVLTSPEAKQATHPMEVGIGRDIAGKAQMVNLSMMPHLLIAGQTGGGKSSCINGLVTSILMRCTPEQVRMILIDPKRVELGAYNGLPHLLTEVVTNPKKAANALDWAVREMDMRYDLLAGVGVRDIAGYNAMYDRGELPTADNPDPVDGKQYERLPYILLVVDELNDLMMVAARDVETSICRIAQMARAVGVHLVIATQRPSVDVITGVIKANIPSRLAFSVSTLADSRVILDQPGAEKLIGNGDMLLLAASSSRAQRIQGSWVDEECVRKVVAHWRRQVQVPQYIEGLQGDQANVGLGRAGDTDDDDELLAEAMELVVRSGLGSTSMLQRKLRVGFARAGRLMDLMERKGIVGPSEGSKARSVLMTVEEFEAMQVADA